jgi:hypothetical protein
MADESSSIQNSYKQDIIEREKRLFEREQLLIERKAKQEAFQISLNERERSVMFDENGFAGANLEQDWERLWDAQTILNRNKRLTSCELDERELKLEIKKQKLKRSAGLMHANQNNIDRGIYYPNCRHCGRS